LGETGDGLLVVSKKCTVFWRAFLGRLLYTSAHCPKETSVTSVRSNSTTLPLTEVRDRLSEIVEDVSGSGSEWTITRHGRPVAVIVGADDYEALIETLNILSDDDTMAALAEADVDVDAGRVSEA
jgi:antitoxin YefM